MTQMTEISTSGTGPATTGVGTPAPRARVLMDEIKEMQDRLEKQEKFLAEIITWLKEYFPNMGYTPELREEEWKILITNIQLINKGKQPKRREEVEAEMEEQEAKKKTA